MRRLMILAATGTLATAMPAAAQQGQIIQLGDSSLSCPQIVEGASQLAQTLGGAPEGGVFSSEQAINAATSVAIQGALMSGAGRVIPGMGMLGNAMGAMARRDRERREAERLVAQQRWYYLNGLYTGRNCDQQLAQSAAPPAAEAAPPEMTTPEAATPTD
ncbi:MAG: hypothetical protein KKC29_01610 [Alphaproteobacteria bacterium]|jgi:hypothetical protein|nr:hypothetical protein [Alphaproteobacteria bacterium]MBU2042805.1 hypothetical protein [Alphaproteobacteria bacterium]MBU2126467.1 hypothetical protein [Alphaproteobacteria bacterium]MBU2207949.1 hypothetical protein [Alphaproteobacteria bacterium]MBU2289783.1 hypothetical protein [Alphaproteobacteria bacterium]